MSPLAPLLSDRPVVERLEPFRLGGVLGSLDVHVVDHLAVLVGETDPDVVLALCLAVRAPRHGHICMDLARLRLVATPTSEDGAGAGPLPWPDDLDDWLERVRRSPLVRSPAERGARPFVLDGTWLYPDRYHAYQERLATRLGARLDQPLAPADRGLLHRGLRVLFDPPPAGSLDRQQLGAAMAMLRGFTVISGGPGTGKTYTVRSVLTLLWAQWAASRAPDDDALGPRVALAAPTGKAAARMRESIVDDLAAFTSRARAALADESTEQQLHDFLTALEPSTLHRLLGYNPANPTRPRHDAANPLPYDVVVVDEASMVDFAMMTRLVEATGADARLVLLGDQHQLASVEAGTVLADICGPVGFGALSLSRPFVEQLDRDAGLDVAGSVDVLDGPGPHDAIVQLDRSRRFGADSGIAHFARACLDAHAGPAAAAAVLDDPRFTDVERLVHGERGQLTRRVEQLLLAGYAPTAERLRAGPRPGQSEADFHREVLDTFDRFRVLCAHRRGRLGVEGLNQAIVRLLAREHLDVSGEYWPGRPLLVLRNDYVVGRYNGDIGLVVRRASGELAVAFPEEEGVSWLAPSRLPEHQTVFAMTIHKSQGSEFDHAVVVLPDRPSPLLTRELVYTAVTRARERMTLVGDRALVESAVAHAVRRASGLRARLWG